MKANIKRKIIGVFLAIAMIVTFMPSMALAAEEPTPGGAALILLNATKAGKNGVKLSWNAGNGDAGSSYTVYAAADAKKIKWTAVKKNLKATNFTVKKIGKAKLKPKKIYRFYVQRGAIKSDEISFIVGGVSGKLANPTGIKASTSAPMLCVKNTLTVESQVTMPKGKKALDVKKYSKTKQAFTYKSDNEVVATVNENGVVKGISEGVAKIYVQHYAGLYALAQVQVIKPQKLGGKVFYVTDEGKENYVFMDKDNKILPDDDMSVLFKKAKYYALLGEKPEEEAIFMAATDLRGNIIESSDEVVWSSYNDVVNASDQSLGAGKKNTDKIMKVYEYEEPSGPEYSGVDTVWSWLHNNRGDYGNQNMYIGSYEEMQELSKVVGYEKYWTSTEKRNSSKAYTAEAGKMGTLTKNTIGGACVIALTSVGGKTKLPEPGDLIQVGDGDQMMQCKVLSVNGTEVKLMWMDDSQTATAQYYTDEESIVTTNIGETEGVLKYEGSELDRYLNRDFKKDYMPINLREALVPQEITQHLYLYKTEMTTDDYLYKYVLNDGSCIYAYDAGELTLSEKKGVYAPDIEDFEMIVNDRTITQKDLKQLIAEDHSFIDAPRNWIRSSFDIAKNRGFVVGPDNGVIYNSAPTNAREVQPIFVIDFSKEGVKWEHAGRRVTIGSAEDTLYGSQTFEGEYDFGDYVLMPVEYGDYTIYQLLRQSGAQYAAVIYNESQLQKIMDDLTNDTEKFNKIKEDMKAFYPGDDPDNVEIRKEIDEWTVQNALESLLTVAFVDVSDQGFPESVVEYSRKVFFEEFDTENFFLKPGMKMFDGQEWGRIRGRN